MGVIAGVGENLRSGSFLKKTTKKRLPFNALLSQLTRRPNRKSFCFFFQKEALPNLLTSINR